MDVDNSADLCRLHKWKVGDKLIGTDPHETSTIVITAIGIEGVLAVDETGHESSWDLFFRDWKKIE